jgi:hypothetical protein
MTRAVVLRRAARREFDDAVFWYEERRVGLGGEFVSEIERAIGLAAENAEWPHAKISQFVSATRATRLRSNSGRSI